jgi:site-specific recombinase XerD
MARRKRLPVWFRRHEADALLAAADLQRDRVILMVGLYCGLRVSEIVGLEVPDIDLAEGMLMVREGKGGRDRAVPIPSRLLEALRSWLGTRTTGPVFPSPAGTAPLSVRTVQRIIKRAARKAGIAGVDRPGRVTPHKMRHTFATTLLQEGASIREVQELLGHASVATTEVYTHVTDQRLREVTERLNFGGEGKPAA